MNFTTIVDDRVQHIKRLQERMHQKMAAMRERGAPVEERAPTYSRIMRLNRAYNDTVCGLWAAEHQNKHRTTAGTPA